VYVGAPETEALTLTSRLYTKPSITMTLARKTLGKRRNLKEEKRRKLIRDAAINLFSAKGYDQATLDDLVMEARASKSLVYWYWKSKAALLSELIDTCMTPYEELIRKAVESKEPYEEKIPKFFSDFLALFRQNDKLNKLVHFCSLHSSKKKEEKFNEQVNRHYREVIALLKQLVEQGVESGALRKDLNAEALALSLLAFVEGYIYMNILEERIPLEHVAGLLFSLWVSVFSRAGADRQLTGNGKKPVQTS
jgi:AcrR family transcriptional regulator